MEPLFKVFMPRELELETMSQILYSGKLSFGQYGKDFEDALREYIGNPYLLTTSNNNYATLIAFSAIGLKAGDEVIASPMACLASNQPILSFQAKTVWTDIDPATGSLDPDAVKKSITVKTKAIMHYHWGGYPGYIDEINDIGRSYGIPVIDDAIEAFGSEYNGRRMGNVGSDITCFSFQPVRLPNCIDGGAISFKSPELFEKAKLIRDFGINRQTFRDTKGEISPHSDIALPGYNAMMSEFNSYLGLQQLRHLPALLDRQRGNSIYWDEYFQNEKMKPMRREGVVPNYWIYSVFTGNGEYWLDRMRAQGYYSSRVHLRNDLYSAFGKNNGFLPGVDAFSENVISVPSGWWVNLNK